VEAWDQWNRSRPSDWDLELETRILLHAENDFGRKIATTMRTKGSKLANWKCISCNYNGCEVGAPACPICKTQGKRWSCAGCTCISNNPWDSSCCACGMTRTASHEKVAALNADREIKRLEEEEQKRQEAEARNRPLERYRHPGTFDGCGGNPTGYAKCEESGGCSSCVRCGMGTHWSCCGCTDATSECCAPGITLEQAQNNALIFAKPSSSLRRCMEIPGTFFPDLPEPVDWMCPACTYMNTITSQRCEICDTAAPISKNQPAIQPSNNTSKKAFKRTAAAAAVAAAALVTSNAKATGMFTVGQRVVLSATYRSVGDAFSGCLKPGQIGTICDVPNPNAYNGANNNFNVYSGSGGPQSHYLICPEDEYSAYRSSVGRKRSSAGSKALSLNLWYYQKEALSLLPVVSGVGMGGVAQPLEPGDIRTCEVPTTFSSLGQVIDASRVIDLTDLDAWRVSSRQSRANRFAEAVHNDDDGDDDGDEDEDLQHEFGYGYNCHAGFAADNYDDAQNNVGVDDDDSLEPSVTASLIVTVDSAERDYNAGLVKKHCRFHSPQPEIGPPIVDLATSDGDIMEPSTPTEMCRAQSVEYHGRAEFEPIDSLEELIAFKDKNGNSAAHHCAFMGLTKTYAALMAAGASRFAVNSRHICAGAVLEGVATLCPSNQPVENHANVQTLPLSRMNASSARLYKQLTKYSIVPQRAKVALLQCPAEYRWPADISDLEEALETLDKVGSALLHVYYFIILSESPECFDAIGRGSCGR
jgi:hypothetical protein